MKFEMTNQSKICRWKLKGTVALFLSLSVVVGGIGIRSAVYADGENNDAAPNIAAVSAVPVGEGVGRSYVPENVNVEETYAETVQDRNTGNVSVYINGEKYRSRAFLYKDTTYVGIRDFTKAVAGANVTWNGKTGTATAKTSKTTVTATKGKEYISANGRYLWVRTGIIIENGTMYVPIRPLSLAFGANVAWDGKKRTVNITKGSGTIKSGSAFYDSDEVYWLSKIINAESRGEPMTGKVAVGNVVLNRVRSKDYPDTIYGVIFDRKYGVQFSPVSDGSIHLEPDTDSIIAAKLCLEGYTVSSSILFFINKNIATNMWVTNNRPLAVSIGRHDFYA